MVTAPFSTVVASLVPDSPVCGAVTAARLRDLTTLPEAISERLTNAREAYITDWDAALLEYSRALELLRPLRATDTEGHILLAIGECLCSRAGLRVRTNDTDGAVTDLTDSLAAYDALHALGGSNLMARCSVLLVRAGLQTSGELAIADLDAAVAVFAPYIADQLVADALFTLGQAHLQRGVWHHTAGDNAAAHADADYVVRILDDRAAEEELDADCTMLRVSALCVRASIHVGGGDVASAAADIVRARAQLAKVPASALKVTTAGLLADAALTTGHALKSPAMVVASMYDVQRLWSLVHALGGPSTLPPLTRSNIVTMLDRFLTIADAPTRGVFTVYRQALAE